ncbi:hypothetical protein G7Z17_g5072 [Cylindrodendrum hubeiense]|uniref:Uncharacterized protein n=1 Tax=Cylindrodendrum hubeiense TaxID=595255 RepID=A0A9P5LHP5_9HYPO|nr:hypothetical protein G7Z17_g5072 [Cylindrodendrum hubeiense]
MSDAKEYFGLSCPSGGDFYICEGNTTEFVGCCTSDPCSDGVGSCPEDDLRTSSFTSDKYADLPQLDCDSSKGNEIWFTCAFTSPPFMGCCDEAACNDGCARNKLVPAVLPEGEANRLRFLEPDDDSSSSKTASASSGSTSTSTSSASASASTSAAADKDSGLGTGPIAGIAAGAAVLGMLLLFFLLWKFWWAPRKRRQNGQQFEPVARSMHQPDQPDTPGTFYTGQSPMSHYQQSFASTPTMVPHYPSGVSMDQYGKISPQTANFDRPNSMAAYSDVSSIPRAYGQPYSPVPMIPVQEMDGTTSVPPQELSTGQEQHYQNQAYSPEPSPGFSPGMNHGISPSQSPNPNPNAHTNQLGISNR